MSETQAQIDKQQEQDTWAYKVVMVVDVAKNGVHKEQLLIHQIIGLDDPTMTAEKAEEIGDKTCLILTTRDVHVDVVDVQLEEIK